MEFNSDVRELIIIFDRRSIRKMSQRICNTIVVITCKVDTYSIKINLWLSVCLRKS